MYIIIKRNYPALRVSVINSEIWVVIYTLFNIFGSVDFRKEELKKVGLSLALPSLFDN
jgi:hypothetical protein